MMKFLNNIIIIIIKTYQLAISPFLMPSCKFSPSCSSYAILAIKKYGMFLGLLITIRRILACNPFNKKSGYDPIP